MHFIDKINNISTKALFKQYILAMHLYSTD